MCQDCVGSQSLGDEELQGPVAMLRAAGFTIAAQPEEEVYLCRTAPVPYGDWMGSAAVYPAMPAKGDEA